MTLIDDIDTLTSGYLASLKSNSDEIARLAEALRAAEAECYALRQTWALQEELDAARAELADIKITLSLVIKNDEYTANELRDRLKDARADAEQLVDTLTEAQKSITFATEQEARESGWSLPITVAFKIRYAIAAHRAAQKVTP